MSGNDSPPHILVLDGDASAAQVTRAGVERAVRGANVVVASTPEAAWASAQEFPPDILVIDPVPAELASAWLIQNIKTACPGVYIIVLASAPTRTVRRNGRGSAVDIYLEKPAPLPILVQAIRAALQSKDTIV